MPNQTTKTTETEENIFTRIKNYEHDFVDKYIPIVPGYTFNQLEVIKRINLYYASRYESGNSDDLGTKFFYNFSKPKVKNAAKNLDIGTKDINIVSDDGKDYRRAWVLRRDLRQWLRKRKFGEFINKLVEYCPRFGSVVVKKIPGEKIIEFVDLRNLKNDPTADTLAKSWVLEDHFYTATELNEMKGVWDSKKIDEAIKSFRTYRKENYVTPYLKTEAENMGNAIYIHVRELYDDVPESLVVEGGSEDKIISAQFVVISPDSVNTKAADKGIDPLQGLILLKTKKERPYKDLAYDKEDGRWLGVGVMEDNFEAQMMKNESINQLLLALRLANLIVLATDDKNFAKNIITDVINGDVMTLNGRLQRVPTDIRNLGANNVVSSEIERLSNLLSNSYESTTGATMPSGTPFALGRMLNTEAKKLFEFIRERLGLFMEDILNDWVLPELIKEWNDEHILSLTSKDEMKWLVQEYINDELWNVIKNILRSGRWPTLGDMSVAENILRQRLESKESLYLKLPKSFYKDVLKNCHAVIVNESFDKGERLITLSSILQMLGANPTLIESPIFKQMLDYSGLAEVDVFASKPENPEAGVIDFTNKPEVTMVAPEMGARPTVGGKM